ncbi:MAG: hypothetical protein IJS15_11125, partial [Victivallales bacterium]|nr:hypothetical protein [Victivallales bacterium]
MITDETIKVYAAVMPLVFPHGFTIGGSNGKSNSLEIERDGEGNPVIRGSSMAGLLREAAVKAGYDSNDIEYYFGKALDSGDDRQESQLIVHDMTFPDATETSMHNKMNRHTGSASVVNKALFSVERTAPGCFGNLFLQLRVDVESETNLSLEFLDFLAETLNGGAMVGGNSNRGGGLCRLKDNAYYVHLYNLDDVEQTAEYLDLVYSEEKKLSESDRRAVAYGGKRFTVQVGLQIPKGQDLLCAEGNEMAPVETEDASGKRHWKIPGASLRGVFRGWFSRLA